MERYHMFKLGFAILFYAAYCIRPMLVNGLQPIYVEEQNKNAEPAGKPQDFLVYYQGVEGTPGVDFPIYSHIPRTSFSCKGIESGYYADLDTDCQVFHICEEEKKISFLCPNGTIFQQSDLICEWWFKVNCTDAPNLYAESAEHLREDLARRKSFRKVHLNGQETPHGAVMRMEEASSVSASRNGKNVKVQSQFVPPQNIKNPQHSNAGSQRQNQLSNHHSSNTKHILVSNAVPVNLVNSQDKNTRASQPTSHSKNRRYNDDQTGNFLNNDYEAVRKTSNEKLSFKTTGKSKDFSDDEKEDQFSEPTITTTEKYFGNALTSQTLKEYHIQFSVTSPDAEGYSSEREVSRLTTSTKVPQTSISYSQNNEKPNRGGIKYNQYGDDHTQNPSVYELQFPTHRSKATSTPTYFSSTQRSANFNNNKITNSFSSKDDLTNRKLEHSDSDESQITQESSSFFKNSFNSIQDVAQKHSSANPYPNHRTTYSDLKTPNFTPSKFSTISSVTPQYITTQPINNGKPFFGSRVGASIHTSIGTVPVSSNSSTATNNLYYTAPTNSTGVLGNQKLCTDVHENGFSTTPLINVNNPYVASANVDEESKKTAKVLLGKATIKNKYRTDQGGSDSVIFQTSTEILPTPSEYETTKNQITFGQINIGSSGSPSLGKYFTDTSATTLSSLTTDTYNSQTSRSIVSSSSEPPVETTSRRIIDHATVYGSFSGGTTSMPAPFKQNVPTKHEQSSKNINLHLTKLLSDSTSQSNPHNQVRFNTNSGTPVRFDKNSNKLAVHLSKSVTGPRQRGNLNSQSQTVKNSDKIQLHLSKSLNGGPSSGRPFVNLIQTTPQPFENPKYGNSINPPLLKLDAFVRTSDLKPVTTPRTTAVPRSTFRSVNARLKTYDIQPGKGNVDSGFFVTKNSIYDSPDQSTSLPINIRPASDFNSKTSTQRPRPFQTSHSLATTSFDKTIKEIPVTPTYTNYKISSASPFRPPVEFEEESTPTRPTPFTTPVTSVYENVDNMINVLMKMANSKDPDYSSETPRPGLIVPPSVGPQTLHTLAVYFANALDGIVAEKEKLNIGGDNKITKEELDNLLTQMTVHGYNDLFTQLQNKNESNASTPSTDNLENVLEVQDSKNLVQSPHIRELARNFSIALSNYLHDPDMFKKDLEELRPTEPPLLEEECDKDQDDLGNAADEELLNFSDADTKSSYPPVFPTGIPSPSPTWGFILATKSGDLDVKNSLNPDLNTADSQSFIPSFNNLNTYSSFKEQNKKPFKDLPEDHWTTSPSATTLWRSAFSVHPAVVNEQFETTPIVPSAESDSTESDSFLSEEFSPIIDQHQSEINYELRTLPKLTLNSTQVHGILIDFMNTTSPDTAKLHRLLRRLNTTEEEFLNKMKEIESNPLTKRLVLLLISECGANAAKEIESLESVENSSNPNSSGTLGKDPNSNSYIPGLVSPNLKEDDQDIRALQLLNSLYSIASKFGK